MHRKILFRNKIASGILFLIGIRSVLLTIQAFNLLLPLHGTIGILISVFFFFCSIAIFIPNLTTLKCIKIAFLILSGGMIALTGLITYYAKDPTSKMLMRTLTLFVISFCISLELQQKRQKLHLAQLSEKQKSDTPQRRSTLIAIIIVIILGCIYFFIGKQAQQTPEIIPDAYFEATRLDPNLSAEENGYKEFARVFGTSFDDIETLNIIREKFPYEKWDGFGLDKENQMRRYRNDRRTEKYYKTHGEFIENNPELLEYLQQLEESDFFDQVERIANLQRQDEEMYFPKLIGLQPIVRSLGNIGIYYAEQGEYERAIDLNILQLTLADKYLNSHAGYVQRLIGMVMMDIAHKSTKQLLNYGLNLEVKERLLHEYQETLTINKESLNKNTYKAEYHMFATLTNNFQFSNRDEIDVIGGEKEERYSFEEYLPLTEPFFNRKDTINKIKYGLRLGAENAEIEYNNNEEYLPLVLERKGWNIYNILGDLILEALLPRLQPSQIEEEMYAMHQNIITELQNQ